MRVPAEVKVLWEGGTRLAPSAEHEYVEVLGLFLRSQGRVAQILNVVEEDVSLLI